jgi:hypothetical protein
MFFRSSPYSWEHAFGSKGYVLVREGRIVEVLATEFQYHCRPISPHPGAFTPVSLVSFQSTVVSSLSH